MPPPDTEPPQHGARAVFVYYHVQPRNVAALRLAFAGVVDGLGGWQPRLMRKVEDDRDGLAGGGESPGQRQGRLQTWMEIYRSPAAAQSNEAMRAVIDGCVRRAGILELIEGERHYEIFEPCA